MNFANANKFDRNPDAALNCFYLVHSTRANPKTLQTQKRPAASRALLLACFC